jgi:AcrR family transcriptional regulator
MKKEKKAGRSVGRPRSFESGVALDAALRVFWENGYQSASLATLGDAMGLTPPQIYNAFKDKESLFRLAVERYLSRENAFLDDALNSTGSAMDAIWRLLDGAAKSYTRPGYPRGCLMVTGAIAGAPELDAIVEELRNCRKQAEQRIAERINKGKDELPSRSDVVGLARFFSGVLFGMSLHARDGKSEEELRSYAEIALQAWPK